MKIRQILNKSIRWGVAIDSFAILFIMPLINVTPIDINKINVYLRDMKSTKRTYDNSNRSKQADKTKLNIINATGYL